MSGEFTRDRKGTTNRSKNRKMGKSAQFSIFRDCFVKVKGEKSTNSPRKISVAEMESGIAMKRRPNRTLRNRVYFSFFMEKV